MRLQILRFPVASRHDARVAGALLLFLWLFFAWRIHQGISAGLTDNSVFGADGGENFQALAHHRYWGLGYRKHILACIWAALTVAPMQLAGLSNALAGSISFGFVGAAGPALLFLVFRRVGAATAGAVALTMAFVASYGFVTIASVIETYALTFAISSLALLLMMSWVHADAARGRFGWVLPAVASGIAGWTNLPAAAFALIWGGVVWPENSDSGRQRTAIAQGMTAAATAVVIAAAPIALAGMVVGFKELNTIVATYASFDHFIDGTILRDYAATIGGYVFVSPSDQLACRYQVDMLAHLFVDPVRAATMVGWWVLIGGGLFVGLVKGVLRPIVCAAGATILGFVLFYAYLAPQAALLFALQWFPAVGLLIAPLLIRYPRAWILAAAVALASLWLNAPIFERGPLNDFAAVCPPALQINSGL